MELTKTNETYSVLDTLSNGWEVSGSLSMSTDMYTISLNVQSGDTYIGRFYYQKSELSEATFSCNTQIKTELVSLLLEEVNTILDAYNAQK